MRHMATNKHKLKSGFILTSIFSCAWLRCFGIRGTLGSYGVNSQRDYFPCQTGYTRPIEYRRTPALPRTMVNQNIATAILIFFCFDHCFYPGGDIRAQREQIFSRAPIQELESTVYVLHRKRKKEPYSLIVDPPQYTAIPWVSPRTPASAYDFVASIGQFQKPDCVSKIKLIVPVDTKNILIPGGTDTFTKAWTIALITAVYRYL